MKISEVVSNDVVSLVKFRGLLDDDIECALPPVAVRDCIDMETNGIQPPAELLKEAEAWVTRQRELQTRADELFELMSEQARVELRGQGLPAWIQDPWVAIISMPWSEQLEDAIRQAEACLT